MLLKPLMVDSVPTHHVWREWADFANLARRAAGPQRSALYHSTSDGKTMPRPAVNVAVRAARAAGQIILRYMNRVDSIAVVEKQRLDFASEVDRAAEAEIIRELKRAFPGHAILAEESGEIGKAKQVWVIDPLDGTHNYLRGFPHFSVSIALLENGEPMHGVVYDPLRDELFTASRGDGAYLNDRRIRVSPRTELTGALLATGFPYRQRAHIDTQIGMTRALLDQAEDIRRTGSAALDLAYVANGRFDGYFESGLQPWDMAAGCLLVREAGGRFCDFVGRDGLPDSGNLVAGSIKVVDGIVKTIGPILTPALAR
jgi:myo-inositol-1(or 4)-monophosphatase